MSRPSDPGRPGPLANEAALDEKPFRLAKSFSSVAIVMIFAVVLSLAAVVSNQAEDIITKRVEDDTIKLMENLNHQMYENFLKKVSGPDGKSRLREPAQQALLNEVITNTIFGFDLKRVIIFNPVGEVVYATDQTRLTSRAEDIASFQEAVSHFQPLRHVLHLNIYRRSLRDWMDMTLPPLQEVQPRIIFSPGSSNSAPPGDTFKSEPPETAPPEADGLDAFPEAPDLSADDEENYLKKIRDQTVFRYEGGQYLILKFFPRGNFILRTYKAMEDYETENISGVLEVDRDLTPEYRQIAKLQYFALSMAFCLALGLTLVLRWVVSRGEAILTKRNQEQQDLRARLDQSERLAGLGSMVATVAHEIRNPLGIIHSTADVLSRFLASNPDQARLARAIIEEANRLSEVVTEFLDFARPPMPRLEPMVVEELLEEILAFLEVTLTRAGVEVRTDFRSDQTPTPGDAPMLHRVFLNILINAIQAMDDGGLICIATRLEPADDSEAAWLKITISDTGPGLSEEAAKKLFSPFYTTKAKGTGLGLVIVRNIIEGHGGALELKNGPPPEDDDSGPGLTVAIRLKT